MQERPATTGRISVEDVLARVVRGAGGSLVTDLLPSNTNLGLNADFVFKQYNVVGELKRLEKDQGLDPDMAAKRNRLYSGWRNSGKPVPIVYGTRNLRLDQLPPDCANEMISLYREPIAIRIRKANKQIRATKATLGMEDAIGLLILAQDGDYSIGPGDVLNLAGRCLNGELFSSINDVILLNPNRPANRPGDPLKYLVFAHAQRNPNRCIPAPLLQSLQTGWGRELEAAFGPLHRPGVIDIESLQFRKLK